MKINSIQLKVSRLIMESRTQEAIQLLLNYLKGKEDSKEFQRAVIIASGALNRLNKEKIQNVVDPESYGIRLNHINYDLLNIAEQIPETNNFNVPKFYSEIESHLISDNIEGIFDILSQSIPDEHKSLINRAIVIRGDFFATNEEIKTLPPKESKTIKQYLYKELKNKVKKLKSTSLSDQTEIVKELLQTLNQQLQESKKLIEINKQVHTKDSERTIKILYLYSNPDNLHSIAFGRESKIIKDEQQKGKLRAKFELLPPIGSVRYHEIKSIIEAPDADIIQISVHGSTRKGREGLLFEDDNNMPRSINAKLFYKTIKQALKGSKRSIKCILLTACDSEAHAKIIAENDLAQFTIGMKQAIPDEVSLAFSQGFYEDLFKNNDIEKAFDNGKYKIAMENVVIEDMDVDWEEVPVLYKGIRN